MKSRVQRQPDNWLVEDDYTVQSEDESDRKPTWKDKDGKETDDTAAATNARCEGLVQR